MFEIRATPASQTLQQPWQDRDVQRNFPIGIFRQPLVQATLHRTGERDAVNWATKHTRELTITYGLVRHFDCKSVKPTGNLARSSHTSPGLGNTRARSRCCSHWLPYCVVSLSWAELITVALSGQSPLITYRRANRWWQIVWSTLLHAPRHHYRWHSCGGFSTWSG